jgi:Na+/phosphate symporter
MFNFELDDLIALHPSHAAPVQSFCNSIMTFFGCHRSLDAVACFIIRPFVSALESSASRLVYNGPQTMVLDHWMFPDTL